MEIGEGNSAFTTILEKLAVHEPVRSRLKGSARAKVRVKYNPANLGELHVWDNAAGTFVTLPCVDPEYAEGLTLWQHKLISEWGLENAKADAATQAERRVALKQEIEAACPEARRAKKRTVARLLSSPRIEAIAGSSLRVAHAPPRHDGFGTDLSHS